ncbi:flagellar protein FlgN [Paenibacillus solisilvae]|uniref:Flagellar protein FlgN n=1 Tax=Paenibacillus solisilvae TaxID=2486751 RepID=A0ABW0W9P9_9BACL
MVDAIVEVLEKQAVLYSQLLELAKQKTPFLVKNEVDQLNAAMQKEKRLLKQAEEHEQVRMQLSGQFFTGLGLPRYKGGRLSEMIRTVTSAQDKQKLAELHEQLTSSLHELQKINQLNQQLIEQSLKFIDYSIDIMVEDPHDDITYQHPRSPGYGNPRNGLFDTRG